MRKIYNWIASALLAAGMLLTTASWGAFDPVREDIDIFMVNPAIDASRPNVLILLDNTANWNTAFSNEKSALVSVVNGLTEFYNVGLAMFPETGGGNDSIDGSYIRFGTRQMIAANRTALSTMVNALDQLGDKGNNATPSLALSEIYYYFANATSRSGWGKLKSDYAGNTTHNALAASLPGNAFDQQPVSTNAASKVYRSPIADACQKNFIIYISNGPANENASALATSQSLLTAARGGTAPSTISISPSGQQGNWADEWAAFLAHTGFNVTIGGVTSRAYVNTYVIEVDPGTTGQGPDMTALMKSIATQGKGKYFATSSGNSGNAIVDALNQIFNEIQSVNSVFASTTLPVSVNVRGTHLNQVYIGMFRPDSDKAPRWYGNLKLYNLKASGSGSLYLADANGSAAENLLTGFIGQDKQSFWTRTSNFWDFRPVEQNGAGGGSDAPDGDLVEKGAVGQMLRESYASSQAGRNLYTCTSGSSVCSPCSIAGSGTDKTCTSGSFLSATPFTTGNDAITTASLSLGTQDVASLTAKITRNVTALTDRRQVSLNNSTSTPIAITLSNGAITHPVNSLSTALTRTLTALTGVLANTVNITSIAKVGGNFVATTSAPHGFAAGATVTIAGNSIAAYNGTWSVASPTSNTFQIAASGNPGTGSGGTATTQTNSTTARATLTNHGFSNGQSVTIAGANPTAFNGTFGVTVLDANTFTYSLGSTQGNASSPGTVTANSTTATGTTSTAHGLVTGNSIIISDANPSGYNGTFTVASTPSANSFTYTLGSPLVPNTASGVTVYKVGSGSTTVTATAPGHGLSSGSAYIISGTNPCYTGSYTIGSVTANTFTYTTASVCTSPPIGSYTVSSTTTGVTVMATLPSHGFDSQCPIGNSIAIYGTDTNHTGTYTIASMTADTFSYSTGSIRPTPVGTFWAGCVTSPRAFATTGAHGFSTGDSITISGVDTSGSLAGNNVYNITAAITVIDPDNFSYPITNTATSTASAVSGNTIMAAKNTTTAIAQSINHGFANGSSVSISGASPAAFNGNFTITALGANSFQYTLGSAQGDASGTILASAGSGSSTERDQIIQWVRGQDNAISPGGENANGSMTDCRASVHGDVLHSRPAVINYNRYAGDNDVYVFYGANNGVFHAVKGGITNDATDPGILTPGQEAWGFVPPEGFSQLKRLRNNSPQVGSDFKKPYFMDGPIGSYVIDANNNGKLTTADTGDKVYLYIGARRGGRYLYSLDVTNPLAPTYRWKIDNGTTGFFELGQTWSQPTIVTGINAHINPVLLFGGGYDPSVEDIENCTVTSATSTAVTYSKGTITYNTNPASGCTVSSGVSTVVNRSMGRAIYMVDAITGELIWSAGRPGSGATLEVSGMDFAIPADIQVIKNESGGATNRAYAVDTGGNVWRIDFGAVDKANWTVTKLAAIGDLSTKSGRRKFLYPPDVVSRSGYDAVLIGTGDREHPFDVTVTNRFYMFKDLGGDSGAVTGASVAQPTLTEAALYDTTSNCIQDCTGTTQSNAITALESAKGWYFSLGTGEKNIGNAIALAGVVFFNTNQPSQSSDNCGNNLGIARQYQVAVADATAVRDVDASGILTVSDRSSVHAGGGYLPSPVHVVVQIDGQIYEGVISGTSVQQPPGTTIGSRSRRYWYREID